MTRIERTQCKIKKKERKEKENAKERYLCTSEISTKRTRSKSENECGGKTEKKERKNNEKKMK